MQLIKLYDKYDRELFLDMQATHIVRHRESVEFVKWFVLLIRHLLRRLL
jgi:hypothetical protein